MKTPPATASHASWRTGAGFRPLRDRRPSSALKAAAESGFFTTQTPEGRRAGGTNRNDNRSTTDKIITQDQQITT
jgi:hypothetical protein